MENFLPSYFLDQCEQIFIILDHDLKIHWMNKSALSYFEEDMMVFHTYFIDFLKKHGHPLFPFLLDLETSSFENLDKKNPRTFETYQNSRYISWQFLTNQKECNSFYSFACIGSDISQSKKLEEDFKNIEKRLDSVIESMPGNYWWKDINGIYRGYNNALIKTLGLNTKNDVIGKSDYELPWKEQAANLYNNDDIVLKTGKAYIAEEKVLSKTGKLMTFVVTKVPLRNSKEEIIGTIGNSVDITAQKILEYDLRVAKEKAEAANNAKREFLANMRHDLRTPFTGILGLAQAMAEEETEPKKKEYLSFITDSAQALLNHINEIFEFVQLERGQLPILEKQFNIYQLLDNVLKIMLPSAKAKDIDFTLNISHDLPMHLMGDEVRTQRILINLISNAIKFTEHGYVKVNVSAINKVEGKIILDFTIEDTGIGIPEDKENIIFERFNRLTSAYSGVYPGKGLGLKMVRQFLEEIGGQSYLKSALGKGTTFKIFIPYQLSLLTYPFNDNESRHNPEPYIKNLSHNETSNLSPIKNLSKENIKRDLEEVTLFKKDIKILLVEDQMIAAYVAEKILSSLDCQVDIAKDGKMALELIEKNHYDLIFMDIGLPDIDGYEVTERIRSHTLSSIAHIPIVALTAHIDSDSKQRCLNSKINDILNKPLTPEKAKEVLDTYLLF